MEFHRIKLFIWIVALLVIAAAGAFLPALASLLSNKDLPAASGWVSPTPSLVDTLPILSETTSSDSTPDPALTSVQVRNCIYPVAYWAAHPEAWPEQVSIEELIYSKNQALALYANQAPDAAGSLFIQLHAAYLNASGGPQSIQAGLAIQAAARWLAAHPPGGPLSPADQDIAAALANPLASYNNGLLIAGLCASGTRTPTFQPARLVSATPTASPTPTVTETAAFLPYLSPPPPSATPTHAAQAASATPTNPPVLPSATSVLTALPSATPPPTALPTATRPPTATPVILPTPAPTNTPLP